MMTTTTTALGRQTLPDPSDAALHVSDYRAAFVTDGTRREVLRGVSFTLPRGSFSAIVGESGSGKSLTALSILGLAPQALTRIDGSITYDSRDIAAMSEAELRTLRGSRIGMVFQDARLALNPVFTVGQQLSRASRIHHRENRRQAADRAADALASVRIPDVRHRMKQYPHEFSGGMAQRVALALALIPEPDLLLLDEPTTGLDVTIQADVVDLVADISAQRSLTTCLITHDLGLVGQYCDHVIVMRDGRVCEETDARTLLTSPAHPYSQRLIQSSLLGTSKAPTDA
jgi:ABC-type dipeptide/oligopeptide/nickel transport system ATPase component